VEAQGDADAAVLVTSPCFVVEKYGLKSDKSGQRCESMAGSNDGESSWRSVEILVGLNGCGVVEAQGCEPVTLGRGDAVVVPAAIERFSVRGQWEVECLTITLPPRVTVEEPYTSL
jgi:mannose-6-phosphate isomerase class I